MAGTRQVALTHATDFGRLSAMRRSFLDAANADRRGGQHSTGVRWWVLFCTWGRGINPILDPRRLRGDDDYRLEAEDLLEDFAVWLAVFRPSGRQIKYKSIQKYISSVRAWYSRFFRAELGVGAKAGRIGDILNPTSILSRPTDGVAAGRARMSLLGFPLELRGPPHNTKESFRRPFT